MRRELIIAPLLVQNLRMLACLAGKLELLSEKSNALPISLELCAFSPDGTKFVSGADAST